MKKFILLLCVFVAIAAGLSSCKAEQGNATNSKKEKYTLYMGVHQDHSGSEGKVKFSSTVAAVICDEKGKIVDCVFDATENNIKIESGIVQMETDIRSKNEQGLEYSMKSASAIGREWYEQARHFAQFIKGRTLDEADDVDGGEAELMAGCTIDINGFKKALDEADDQENSVSFESAEIPHIAVAVVNNDDGTKDASEQTDGVASLKSTYAAVAKIGGRIAASNIDETEVSAYFDESGLLISLDKSEGKRDMGYSYGMKSASEIGLEWFEQVRNFEKYIVGLTPDEVAVIDMNGDYSADETLFAGCTIKINDFVKAVAKTVDDRI